MKRSCEACLEKALEAIGTAEGFAAEAKDKAPADYRRQIDDALHYAATARRVLRDALDMIVIAQNPDHLEVDE